MSDINQPMPEAKTMAFPPHPHDEMHLISCHQSDGLDYMRCGMCGWINIREALAAEREANARIAEAYTPLTGGSEDLYSVAQGIADKIRSGK